MCVILMLCYVFCRPFVCYFHVMCFVGHLCVLFSCYVVCVGHLCVLFSCVYVFCRPFVLFSCYVFCRPFLCVIFMLCVL